MPAHGDQPANPPDTGPQVEPGVQQDPLSEQHKKKPSHETKDDENSKKSKSKNTITNDLNNINSPTELAAEQYTPGNEDSQDDAQSDEPQDPRAIGYVEMDTGSPEEGEMSSGEQQLQQGAPSSPPTPAYSPTIPHPGRRMLPVSHWVPSPPSGGEFFSTQAQPGAHRRIAFPSPVPSFQQGWMANGNFPHLNSIINPCPQVPDEIAEQRAAHLQAHGWPPLPP